MKTNITFKHILLALTLMVSVTACKKDKKDEPTPTPPEVKAISLTDLKALSTGASVKVPDNKKITGIVISDVSSKNIDSKTVVLQEAAGQNGIIVSFDAAQTFALGDQVEVVISNQTLAQVNGEIELTNVPAANAKKTGTGTITPKVATAAEIATNKVAWNGTLVSITSTDLTLTGGNGKYAGSLTLTDASGNVTSNVMAGAAFENTAYPVSVSSVTGIVRVNGTASLLDIRKTSDVSSGAVTRVVTEDFSNLSLDGGTPFDPHINPAFLSANAQYFSTASGNWNADRSGGSLWYFPGSQFDGGYTTTGRTYLYMLGSASGTPQVPSGQLYSDYSAKLKNVKTVSVTFAGSKMSGNNLFADYTDLGVSEWGVEKTYTSILPFDAAKDYCQVAITAELGLGTSPTDPTASATLFNISTKYTQTGQFYTLTYTVPTQEQLVAAGLTAEQAAGWLTAPQFTIWNLSARKADQYGNITAPILIDKIVFGF